MPPASPNPLRATVRIVLLALSALLIFGITALIFAFPLLWFRNNTPATAGIALLGVVCGLIVWLFVAVFHIRRVSLTLPADNGADLAAQLRRELEELGYEAGEPNKGRTIFKPGFTAYLAGGVVQMIEHPGGAVVTGPKFFIELLRKRMKILQHLSSVHQTIKETRVRHGQHLLRRVEIDLRVTATQWQKIYDDVISVLADQDANLVCEVHIMAQNESGVLDKAAESSIRERLKSQNIPVEIRKETRPSGQYKLAKATAN